MAIENRESAMKTITTRRFLIPALLVGALGATGIGVAANDTNGTPNPTAKNAQPPPAASTMRKGRLGVVVLPISEQLRAKLGAARDRGVLVDAVQPDSPAAKAGLRVGDVITAVDGAAVQSAGDIMQAMADRKKGDTLKLSVVRDGKPLDLNAVLVTEAAPRGGFRGDEDSEMPPAGGSGEWHWLQEPDSGGANAGEVQRQLDETRKRLDGIEQRLDKLEHR
jgi:membrane-associated protease RseP (regulator of RpoE activity)